jgi:hypothetical protein
MKSTWLNLMVRDNKTKTNHEHEVFVFGSYDMDYELKEAKEEFDKLYPNGYTISLTHIRRTAW